MEDLLLTLRWPHRGCKVVGYSFNSIAVENCDGLDRFWEGQLIVYLFTQDISCEGPALSV